MKCLTLRQALARIFREAQKARLAEQIVEDVVATLDTSEDSVSVAIEEVKPQEWTEKVYKPEIAKNMAKVYKKPGYEPL